MKKTSLNSLYLCCTENSLPGQCLIMGTFHIFRSFRMKKDQYFNDIYHLCGKYIFCCFSSNIFKKGNLQDETGLPRKNP